MAAIRALVAGNWKMNGLGASIGVLAELAAGVKATGGVGCDVMICPPATLVRPACEMVDDGAIQIGGQDCHGEISGAHTGDISAEMLADAGASAVIVGHSERRADHGESDAVVRVKAAAAHRAGLTAIICIGETEVQRLAGEALSVVSMQLKGSLPDGVTADNTIIAYEPVWAIGTGLTPTTADVAEVHARIRDDLKSTLGEGGVSLRILYGGSVKPANARELMGVAHVNGALVGGASLKAGDFLGIIAAYS